MPSKLKNLWNDKKAKKMSAPERLQYRSNLLGSDLRMPLKASIEVLSMKMKW